MGNDLTCHPRIFNPGLSGIPIARNMHIAMTHLSNRLRWGSDRAVNLRYHHQRHVRNTYA
jgi:hypothetical protein